MEATHLNGIVDADLRKKLIEIFDDGVFFKLKSHSDKNWKMWNMFLDCGTATICIIDTEHSPFIFKNDDKDEEPLKRIAFKKLMEEYQLRSCRFYEDGEDMFNTRYVCLKGFEYMCFHKFDCGCKKKRCEECEEYWNENEDNRGLDCEDEDCCEYYRYRNDNCNCGSRDCFYCNERQ